MQKKRSSTGVAQRHSRACASRQGSRCDCSPTYQAQVFLARENRRVSKSFPTRRAAERWRGDVVGKVHRGEFQRTTKETVREAARRWLQELDDGTVRARGGEQYKPSTVRSYRESLENRILPDLGYHRVADLRLVDLQDYANRLLSEGREPSTVKNLLMPLRAMYRRALAKGTVGVNPCAGLEFPTARGRRDRVAEVDEARDRIAELPTTRDRAAWGCLFYAGLRLGEAAGLRWTDIDIADATVHVRRAWDWRSGEIEPKYLSQRDIPMIAPLRELLVAHRAEDTGAPADFAFRNSRGKRPFMPKQFRSAAKAAWTHADPAYEWLEPHCARHTFASWCIAAGLDVKTIAELMGHKDVTLVWNRYGHLLQDAKLAARDKLDEFMDRAATGARLDQVVTFE